MKIKKKREMENKLANNGVLGNIERRRLTHLDIESEVNSDLSVNSLPDSFQEDSQNSQRSNATSLLKSDKSLDEDEIQIEVMNPETKKKEKDENFFAQL